MAAPQAGGAPTERGAPGSRFRGSGLAPGSAQSPPGSRPIESGFLGKTWTGPGRVLGRPPPSGGSDRGPRDRRGCDVPSAALPAAAGGYGVTLTTVLPSRPLVPTSTPRTHSSLRLKGAASQPRRGGWGGGRLKGQRGTLHPNLAARGRLPGSLSRGGPLGGGGGTRVLPTMGILRGTSGGHRAFSPFPAASPFLCTLLTLGRGREDPHIFPLNSSPLTPRRLSSLPIWGVTEGAPSPRHWRGRWEGLRPSPPPARPGR